ncbi:MAG: Hpt domain-containing protein [Octadecabacter sp.]|nr:Hpt domain-containing protein [Octadecabacter sp.]
MKQDSITDNLKPIRARFISVLTERQKEIVTCVESAMQTPEKATAELVTIESILHKIAGTAGTLGFSDLGDRARAIENLILTVRKTGGDSSPELWIDIVDWVEASIDLTKRAA